jgi:hypothetical protein
MKQGTKIVGVTTAARLAAVADRELDGQDPSWVNQWLSPLGEERHVEAVRSRALVAREYRRSPRELGAMKRGATYLLSQEALAEELGWMRRSLRRGSKRGGS